MVFIKPRTNETKKFLSNLKEIDGLRFEHKWTTVRIGKQFGIRPQQLRYMLRYYLGGAIERFRKREIKRLEKEAEL